MVIQYPIYIEVPEGYCTTSTTIVTEEYNPNEDWHKGEDDED